MALKRTLTAEQHAALPADFQKEYKAAGANFVLDVEGDDGTDWKKKRDIEAEHRTKAEAKAQQFQNELDEMRRGNIPKADVDALENSYKARQTEDANKHKTEVEALTNALGSAALDSIVTGVTTELFTVPTIMDNQVRSRLKVELVDHKAVVRVLDRDGKPSAMNVDDLKKEFIADAKLAPVLIGSKANGSGAGGSGSTTNGSAKVADFVKMNDKERTEMYNTNPAEFDRLSKAANQPPPA